MEKEFETVEFHGYTVRIEKDFTAVLDEDGSKLMVLEKDFTDVNAALVYLTEEESVQIFPRWQTNFIVKENEICIIRENGGR
ncbi:hypothetical protein [Streptococcus gallinaceus]|uniref:Uncharacterized protein n=1 Tax=Streptococcus gallinaceus TaxID=165758 RepID=A0ABV2JP50_9STRE|nr:hypothetical protein [Streptococcus gallinaceus]MCP1640090.1 hypothetical protein [Streptococcus gallinaceus]MCP1770872.1 hypothetical protein [Streptococcus gallinaceus]CRH92422.1 Uncharacterised protein [Chlamydia trachomatis]